MNSESPSDKRREKPPFVHRRAAGELQSICMFCFKTLHANSRPIHEIEKEHLLQCPQKQ
jgi:hypothetical protein